MLIVGHEHRCESVGQVDRSTVEPVEGGYTCWRPGTSTLNCGRRCPKKKRASWDTTWSRELLIRTTRGCPKVENEDVDRRSRSNTARASLRSMVQLVKTCLVKKWSWNLCRHDRVSLPFNWKTTCSQEKDHGQDPGNHIEDRNQYQITDLWWQRSLHRWWWRKQETQVPYGGQEVGRRKGTEEVVVIWTMIVSKDLIIKSLILDFSSLSDYQRHWQSNPRDEWSNQSILQKKLGTKPYTILSLKCVYCETRK